jgi:hypothetical protein
LESGITTALRQARLDTPHKGDGDAEQLENWRRHALHQEQQTPSPWIAVLTQLRHMSVFLTAGADEVRASIVTIRRHICEVAYPYEHARPTHCLSY